MSTNFGLNQIYALDYKITESVNSKYSRTIRSNLNDYRGQWLVLFFYPADFTFVCPTELRELADSYDQFQKANTEVLSVSTDTVFTHKAWQDSSETIKAIKFPIDFRSI